MNVNQIINAIIAVSIKICTGDHETRKATTSHNTEEVPKKCFIILIQVFQKLMAHAYTSTKGCFASKCCASLPHPGHSLCHLVSQGLPRF